MEKDVVLLRGRPSTRMHRTEKSLGHSASSKKDKKKCYEKHERMNHRIFVKKTRVSRPSRVFRPVSSSHRTGQKNREAVVPLSSFAILLQVSTTDTPTTRTSSSSSRTTTAPIKEEDPRFLPPAVEGQMTSSDVRRSMSIRV